MPDVLDTSAPSLSATSDKPLSTPEPPPTSASSNPADIDAGRAVKEVGPLIREAAAPEPVAEEPAAAPAAPVEPAPPAEPKGVAKRIAELTALREQANRLAETERSRAEAVQKQLSDALELLKARETKASETPRPNRQAYDTPEAYDAALIEWSGKQATRAAQEAADAAAKTAAETAAAKAAEDARAAQEAEQAKHAETVARTWTERRNKAMAEMPDFAEVAESDAVTISVPMRDAILAADNGPAIAYHLGKNPEEAARIAGMPPGAAIFQMGLLAAKLALPPPVVVSKTPAPIRPLGNKAPAVAKTVHEMSMEEYAATRAPPRRHPFLPGGARN